MVQDGERTRKIGTGEYALLAGNVERSEIWRRHDSRQRIRFDEIFS
jgi:hypothetical protein